MARAQLDRSRRGLERKLDAGSRRHYPENRIRTSLRLPISPLSIEREITLTGNTVQLDYRLQNLSGEPFEYLWAFHPMLRTVPGDRLVLPADCRHRAHARYCLGGCPFGHRGDAWPWPKPLPGVDLSRLDLGGDRRAVKLYTEPLSDGMAAIENETTGDRLTFRFHPAELDTVGIWINGGALNGMDEVAIEPTNAAPDALDAAVRQWKRHGIVAPEQIRRWSFSMELSGSRTAGSRK